LTETGQTPEERQPEHVNVLQNALEMEAKAKHEAEMKERARQAAANEAQYQAREEYAKTLQEEKVELIRMKQGEEFDEDLIYGEEKQQKQYTFTEKLGNWLYHSKWWLGMAAFAVFIVGFLVYDYVTRVDPDVRILLLSEQPELYAQSSALNDLLTGLTEDFNEDGQPLMQSVYVPISKETMENSGTYSASYNSQLMVQFQTDTCMLVIADPDAEEYLQPDVMFEDLSVLYPDCKYVDGYKLMIGKTDLAAQIGMTVPFKDGAYLALRIAKENMNTQEEMEEAQSRAKKVLDNLLPTLHENA
jgi:hypothetical protein